MPKGASEDLYLELKSNNVSQIVVFEASGKPSRRIHLEEYAFQPSLEVKDIAFMQKMLLKPLTEGFEN